MDVTSEEQENLWPRPRTPKLFALRYRESPDNLVAELLALCPRQKARPKPKAAAVRTRAHSPLSAPKGASQAKGGWTKTLQRTPKLFALPSRG